MRIACLQFAPQLGEVEENIAQADGILAAADTSQLDLLVLPELAFSGYNFPSLSAITPYLEPTGSGPSTQWAKAAAKRLNCIVTVGYPERSDPATDPSSYECTTANLDPTSSYDNGNASKHYNSTVTVSPNGRVLANYRKTHLYYTDETWAAESPTGWLTTTLPLRSSLLNSHPKLSGLQLLSSTVPQATGTMLSTEDLYSGIRTAFGICMDLNPYRFQAEGNQFEFVTHVMSSSADLVTCSMAWLTHLPTADLISKHKEPDYQTLTYWLLRLQPLIDADKERVVVLANRCGEEEGDARYAGTAAVMGLGNGKAKLWGIMGRGENGLLSVDTGSEAGWNLTVDRVGKEDAN